MLTLKIFAFVGFASLLFAEMYWGPKPFTKILEFLSNMIKKILPEIPRTTFVTLSLIILIEIGFLPLKLNELNIWETILSVTGLVAIIIAGTLDISDINKKRKEKKSTSKS